MPQNTTILLIRHAEKPTSGPLLTVAGQARAQAYIVYFQNYPSNAQPVTLHYLFAAADSDDSHRPRLTITPLADALGLSIIDTYKDNDYQTLAQEILREPQFNNTNILICWHHGEILDLAAALGVDADKLPHHAHWPEGKPPQKKPWPEEVYGWVLQLSYGADGTIDPQQTKCVQQHLMYTDCKHLKPHDDPTGADN
ncbi:MAG: hypothetical protein ICV83_33675 [Cytophagales bacterium]|nr:hypothetical protein [Cytophagales bacterium]